MTPPDPGCLMCRLSGLMSAVFDICAPADKCTHRGMSDDVPRIPLVKVADFTPATPAMFDQRYDLDEVIKELGIDLDEETP